LSPRGSRRSAPGTGAAEPGSGDPGPARDRTALAWTRSALNLAGSGTLIAHAAFVANLDVLGVACAIGMATMAILTWRHGQTIYAERSALGTFRHHQPRALRRLTAATLLTAAVAIMVTLAI
jgi:Domain of unknown function (DUF202)